MYRFKKIIGLSVLYYLALIVLGFCTVFLEYSMAEVVDTRITWIFFFPWSTKLVEVNPLCYAAGILLASTGCFLLGKWHGAVLAHHEEGYTKGQKTGFILLLIPAVILCLLAEAAAYFLVLFDATVKNGFLFVTVSFLLVPVFMVIRAIRSRSILANRE
jgi:hypothetical protein